MTTESNYMKYRGKCREMSEAAVAEDPSLTLVRGWYYCPVWDKEEQQHWWTKRPDGTIHDPTRLQFPSAGVGIYREYDGMLECECCHATVEEEKAYIDGHHVFCSYRCYGHTVMG